MLHEGSLAEEIEVLEAIYIEELDVHRNEKDEIYKIILQLHPATGEDLEKRFVCMTLILDLSIHYPDMPPEITIRNPRGIAEEELLSLREDMHKLCEDRRGGPVLFELIELAKDSLTAGNIPHCLCMICLEHFTEGENYTKTECYHYFHESCLSRYVTHVLTNTPEVVPTHTMPVLEKSKIVCPVCREEISYKLEDLNSVPAEDSFVFTASAEMRDMQARMEAILIRQKANGGIIDVEAEKNKYLVKHDDVVLLAAPPKLAVNHDINARPKSGQTRNEKTCLDSQQRNSGRRSNESPKDNADRDNRARTRLHSGYMKGKRRDMRFDNYKSYYDSDISEQKKRDKRKDETNSDRVLKKDLGWKTKRQDKSCSDREDYESKRNAREYESEHCRSNRDRLKGMGKSTSYEVKCNDVREKNNIEIEEKADSSDILAKMNEQHHETRKSHRNGQDQGESEQKESDKPQQMDTYGRTNDSVELESNRKYVNGTCNKSDRKQDRMEHKGFGKPTPRKFEKEVSDSTGKSELNIVDTNKRNQRERQGFGQPPRKDSIKSEKRDIKHQLEQSETKSAASDSYQQKLRKSDEEVKLKDDLERSGNLKDARQIFKSSRGGFDRPKDKTDETEEEYKGSTGKPSQDTSNQGRGGFGRPNEKYYRDRYYSDEKRTQKNKGGFGKPHNHNREDFKENVKADSKHGSCEKNKEDWHSDKISPNNESLKLTKTGQRNEDFNLDKTSSHNGDVKLDKTKLSIGHSQSKSESRRWKNDRDSYCSDDRYNCGNWRSRESFPKSEVVGKSFSGNLHKYGDFERVNNGRNIYRRVRNDDVHERGNAGSGRFGQSRGNYDNSHDDCDGYEKERNHDFTQNRNEADCGHGWKNEGKSYSHQLGRGRGKGKYRGENQSGRESRSSPRNNKQVNGVGVGKKSNNMEMSECESERANKQGRDGNSSKTESVDDGDNTFREDVGDKKDMCVKEHGPPGFAVSPPPGFIGTGSDGKSSDSKHCVQPPPVL